MALIKQNGTGQWISKGPQKHKVTAQAGGLNLLQALGSAERWSSLRACKSLVYTSASSKTLPVKLLGNPLHVGGILALGKGALGGEKVP